MNHDHRPWPIPDRPWVMTQRWHDLLFAHWPVPVEEMRRLVPAPLELDTWDGMAWVGLVPFGMSDVKLRGVPPIPGASAFPEMNVRTYVTFGGKHGVHFFSLDAGSLLAVAAARTLVGLPYYWAEMSLERKGDDVSYASRRKNPGGPAALRARYRPTGAAYRSTPGSIDHWLTARYCLFTVRMGKVFRLEIDHDPWPLRPAAAEIEIDTVTSAAGIRTPLGPPLLHFADRLEVRFWSPTKAGSAPD